MVTTITMNGETNIFVSGKPGSGKTTLIKLVVRELSPHYKIGGIITPEIKANKRRIGFKVTDVSTGKSEIFSSINIRSNLKVGKYFVDIEKFEKIAINALANALNFSDLIVIDEIGRMELLSRRFSNLVKRTIESDKILLATVHRSLFEKYKKYGKTIWLSRNNFGEIKELVKNTIESMLVKRKVE